MNEKRSVSFQGLTICQSVFVLPNQSLNRPKTRQWQRAGADSRLLSVLHVGDSGLVAAPKVRRLWLPKQENKNGAKGDDMRPVRLTALSMAILLLFSGCRKETQRGAAPRQYSVAAVVQCFKPGQPVQWSQQIIEWPSRGSEKQALQIALNEINTKNVCRARTGDNLNDGLCWWIGPERSPPCIAGPK